MAEEQKYPTMSGWRSRQMRAQQRRQRQENMEPIRAARAANARREAAIARGEEPEPEQPRKEHQRAESRRTPEHESATVPSGYPDSDSMDRDSLFAYLKAHGHNPGPATKDETLRAKVREVRDGGAEED